MSTLGKNPWRILAAKRGICANTTIVTIPDISDRLLDKGCFGRDEHAVKAWIIGQFFDKKKDVKTGGVIDLDGTVITPKQLYPEWRFNHQVEQDGSGFTVEGRNSFLCVYAKMVREGLWSEVLTVTWVGPNGEILFRPRRNAADLQTFLTGKGYVDRWFSSDKDWGVRSHLGGVELHFRYNAGSGLFNAHIDLHNPGDTPSPWVMAKTGDVTPMGGGSVGDALEHWWRDKEQRKKTHTWQALATALRQAHIPVITVP